LQIVDVNRIFNHVHAEVIGPPDGHTGFDATSGSPHREATGMMIPARLCLVIVPEVAERSPAELSPESAR
jgi:hypothetical protein